jgi:hypothetical protein
MAIVHAVESNHEDRLFFTAMGAFVALVVFAGFARTYYLGHWFEPPDRAPHMTLLLHVHALVFTTWIVLGVVQPALIARGRPELHRRLGLGGAGLALLVWLFGNLAAIEAMEAGYRGLGDPYAFYAVTFFSIQAFGLIVALGIKWRARPHAHKRLMLLSSASILEAAIGRMPLQLVAETAPLSFYVGADLIIALGAAYDLMSRGRIHKVWLWGGGLLIASQFLRVAIMHSALWLAFAHGVAGLW